MAEEEEKFVPRNYQVQLMNITVEQNTIIYLPTGSGKTFIAIMVLKRLSEVLSKRYSDGGKISCILVNSVALADQHAKYVRDHTVFTVGAYTGEMNLDFWTKEQWEEQFNNHQVIIMTAQILQNLLLLSFIDLEKINLLIFDECHRGVDDQPMRQIMRHFQNACDQPRVLGLTATLLNGNCSLNKVITAVRSLETTYQSKVATVDGLDVVIGYSTNPKESLELCSPNSPSSVDQNVMSRLQEVINTLRHVKLETGESRMHTLSDDLKPLEPKDILKKLKNLIEDLIFQIQTLGTFGGYKSCLVFMVQVERIKKHCQDSVIFIVLNYVLTMIGVCKQIFKNELNKYTGKDRVKKFSSDKVIKLFQILEEFKTNSKEELCCLIFVKRRFTAKILHHILQSLIEADPNFSHLKSNFVVGNCNNPYNDTRENLFISKKNKEVLDAFINKEINVLISSNVLEEGIDIPKCTLVVKFDKVEDYRSYIQSKGRARHQKSLYYIIVESDDAQKFMAKYSDFQEIEGRLNELLVGKNQEREAPDESEVERMYNEEEFPPYFVNGPNSAQVNMNSAIALLCRYCLSLPGDQYTTHAAEWYYDKSKSRVVIFLPVVCPILDPIEGPPMRNKRDAKRAAALKACILLHKCQELDDNLLPSRKELKEEDVSYLFEHWPNEKETVAGNKKRRRLHNKQIPDCVNGEICENEILFLHVVVLNPVYAITNDSKAAVYGFYKSDLCFGLLTSKPLPDLCKFPIFDSNGQIDVDIKANVKQITLSGVELRHLREFHFLIFNDLLEILKQKHFLIFDNGGLNSDNILVVPVQVDGGDVSVDFDVVYQHKTLKSKSDPTAAERFTTEVNDDTYLHKIVSPWYRTQPPIYVVTRVCHEKNANSPFPNQEYPSFVAYYEEKHNQKILNPNQPLLLVKGLSQKLNTLKPVGNESKKRKDKKYDELEEYLIPELVVKQEFPACLWIQARFLPSILSRLSYLLKLQQLQTRIARDIGVQNKYLENCPALELDLHLLNYVPCDIQTPVEKEMVLPLESNYRQLEGNALLTRQYNKDFAMKMLEAEYSWKNLEEPKDIERDLNVTVMDIEYYETFISQRPPSKSRTLKNDSPKRHLPAITYNQEFVEKDLQVLDIQFDNQCPNLCDFYQALTPAEANDIVNLERMETLGDSFLKLISSLYIMFKFQTYNEGKATTLKGKLVSNKNLYYLAAKKNLGGILKNCALSPNDEWVPPGFCLPQQLLEAINQGECSINSVFNCDVPAEERISGILSEKSLNTISFQEICPDEENSYPSMCSFLNKQYVSDKTMADAVEALLGAFFLKGGIKGGVKFMEWMGILPAFENVQNLIDTTQIDPVLNTKATHQNIMFHIPQWRELENRLGYHFNNPAFLLQALTHSSYSSNRITQSYERLEFIGDAVLDFLITCYIFEHCGYLTPGQVTDLRSALVNNNTFASLVVRSGFHKFLLMINSKLQGHVDKFADYLARKDFVIDDEVLILLVEEDFNIAESVDVPKVLGDIFEALAGAVYLDSNKDLKTVWRVFYKIMWREIDLFSKNVPKNVIRRLYECHTAYPRFSKSTEIEKEKTVIALEFMSEGRKKIVHGFGKNKNMAKKAAAKIALRLLKI